MTRRALLLGYGLPQPSFRHRMRTLADALTAAGWQVRCEQLPSGRYGRRIWERAEWLRWADVTVLHQIKLAALEAKLLRRYARKAAFDFDDAIYVRKPRHLGDGAGESRWRRAKFASTCRHVDLIAAGNDVLAAAAEPYAARIEILPTAIDAAAYDRARSERPGSKRDGGAPLTVVWIGSPENLIYLELAHEALARVARSFPSLRLRVICSAFPDWNDVPLERIAWSESVEVGALVDADIGIMPLTDDAWARGKCAFKLLQYMAASLPCIASPVGANTEAVLAGRTGFHADSVQAWEGGLKQLLSSEELRRSMGQAGRAHVETRYSMREYRARYASVLEDLANG